MTTRGYCRSREQESALVAHGLAARGIFLEGRGAETFEHCLESFRGRPGTLFIAYDLRLFGRIKRDVAAVMTRLETAGIRVVDITHPEDATVAQLVQRANVAISGARFDDRRLARRQGRAGGKAKGRAAHLRRDETAQRWLVDNIVDHPDLTWATRMELLRPHFTKRTLQRRYGSANRKRGQ